MNVGNHTRKLKIQEALTTSRNAYNEDPDDWQTIAGGEVFGAIEPLSGREMVEAQQQHNDVTHKISIRYKSTVKPKMRIVARDRTFHIRSVRNLMEKDRWQELICTERLDVLST